MSKHTGNRRRLLEQAQAFAAEQVEQGRSATFIIDDLVGQGLDQNTAVKIVDHVRGGQSQSFGRSDRNVRAMVVGGLWFGGGLLVTLITFAAAANGGTYVVAWGAMLWGLIKFAQGLNGDDNGVS